MEQTTSKKKFNRIVFETIVSILKSEKKALYFYKENIRHPNIVTYKRLYSRLKDLTEQEIKNDLTDIVRHLLKNDQEKINRSIHAANMLRININTVRGLSDQLRNLENQLIEIQDKIW